MLRSVRLTALAPRLRAGFASAANAAAAEEQDVVVIGGGPGGYVHAIKAAQLGMKVTCVEKRGSLGGTCLNVGCIPSKNLLHTTHLYHLSKGYFEEHGIVVPGEGTSIDVAKMMESKQEAVTTLTRGIEGLFKKNGVTYSQGWGKITSPNEVTVDLNDGGQEVIPAKKIVIATGSDPIELPFMPYDEKKVVSSTGALALEEVPKKMAVIGGGVIGLELGSVWARLGAEVTVIEFMPAIGAGMDAEIAKNFQRILKRQGLKFMTSTKVTGADTSGDGVVIHTEAAKGGKAKSLDVDVALVSVGRRRFIDGLGLEDVGVATDERGMVLTDENFQTNVPSIYAIGDVRDGAMLAHKAEEEGVVLAEAFHGEGFALDYNSIPSVIYTSPEVAWVGKNEEELKEAGVAYNVGTFPMAANSRAKACGYADGMIKVIADKETDAILGVHLIAESASELIPEAVLGVAFGASSEDIAMTCHAHPTQSEALKEACMAVTGKPIHF
ncbi:dihydrolipoyl dehydrogenase [Thecamonas trahens ATCC 50062]|uniref:Dihydrolipoyl dehydrogenase n=1 Tax=Thecamonas trahens ATCC 50062 TaxID=461836 RepID=A0A0L0DLT0_THETB|nr:dihydrolipoyl dehydrogenase [Thecamonas trahens ATCC 50062]KNC53274.1 dihydrolipoyl dehydrogenase [Thecamonas trahens ATCC 50062]|eukprot:XP_013754538.1 dihydrolipoyl dehydrogenase [Thecamonas trahens ATCC 50062]